MPAGPLLEQHLLAGRQELVVPPPTLTGLFQPVAVNPSAPLHAIEHRIERPDVKPEHAAGAIVDQPGDLVAMPLPFFEDRQDHQVGAAALQLSVWRHMWPDNIASERLLQLNSQLPTPNFQIGAGRTTEGKAF